MIDMQKSEIVARVLDAQLRSTRAVARRPRVHRGDELVDQAPVAVGDEGDLGLVGVRTQREGRVAAHGLRDVVRDGEPGLAGEGVEAGLPVVTERLAGALVDLGPGLAQ